MKTRLILIISLLFLSLPLSALENTINDPTKVYYFTPKWELSSTPVTNGYYRKVIKKTPEGYFLVQDFYQSNKKQSDPIILKNKNELTAATPSSIEGKLILWYENGQKELEVLYKDSKEQGLLVAWYDNGQKQLEKNYVNGKEEGITTQWNEKGEKIFELPYTHGMIDGHLKVWENNIKVADELYKNGVREGVSSYWDINGHKRLEKTYHNNQLNGPYITYFANGNKQSSLTYINGKPQKVTELWYDNGQKAAYLLKEKQHLYCKIWDNNATLIYEGDSSERCLLTIKNIINDPDVL